MICASITSGQSDLNRFYYFCDYLTHVNADVVGRDMFASNAGGGAGTTSSTTSSKRNVVGVAVTTTGTQSTGRALVISGAAGFTFGGGEWTFMAGIDSFRTLYSVGQPFSYHVGFLDAATANQTDGAYFLYDEGGVSTGSAASGNWQCVTVNNSTRTFTTSTVAVAQTGAKLKLVVNADGTEAVFYINDVEEARHSTNIPTTLHTRVFGFGWLMLKSGGTTPSIVHTDYIMAECVYTTPKE